MNPAADDATVRYWHDRDIGKKAERVRSAQESGVDLLGYGEGAIDLNTQVPDGALYLGMAKQ